MLTSTRTTLKPRKAPVQARSTASVDAILEATLQVLLLVGKERLTTTRVAARAGVSVGTLYQYFPNKSSLLQAALQRHFNDVFRTVSAVCREQQGKSLDEMGDALAGTFLDAKLKDGKTAVALYGVSSDVDGIELAQRMKAQMHEVICAMLQTASDGPLRDPALVTTVLQGIMAGISRQLLESSNVPEQAPPMRQALCTLVRAYLAHAEQSSQPGTRPV